MWMGEAEEVDGFVLFDILAEVEDQVACENCDERITKDIVEYAEARVPLGNESPKEHLREVVSELVCVVGKVF